MDIFLNVKTNYGLAMRNSLKFISILHHFRKYFKNYVFNQFKLNQQRKSFSKIRNTS